MKNLFLLIILFKASMLAGQYLNETSVWKQYLRNSKFPCWVYIEDAFIQLDGDTLIGGTTYQKVLKTGMETYYCDQNGDTLYHRAIHKYMDPIRESNKIIYYYSRSDSNEHILYDYGATIGESLDQIGNCSNDKIVSIDHVYLGNNSRKRFHLEGQHEFSTLIEGIGSTFGFFFFVCNTLPGSVIKLQCFSQDGDFIEFGSNPDFDCSSLIVATDRIEKNSFILSPNPFREEFQIHFSGTSPQTASITIVDVIGSVVFDKVIRSPNPVEQIHVPYLPAGTYFVIIRNNESYTTQKLVKL